MAATPMNSQVTWPIASLGASLVTKVMPMPDSTKTMGRMAGSAPGARNLMATCATANATNNAMGTASVDTESAAPVLMTYIA